MMNPWDSGYKPVMIVKWFGKVRVGKTDSNSAFIPFFAAIKWNNHQNIKGWE